MRHTTLARANEHITDSVIISRLCPQINDTIAGGIIDLLASKPGCLQSFWSSIEPSFTSCHVHTSAKELRYAAAIEVKEKIHFPNHLYWLYENNYKREDIRRIRYVIEAFSNAEPMFAILAALALKWLKRLHLQTDIAHCECDYSGTRPTFIAPISLAIKPDANPSVVSKAQVHKFYKALSVWPGYAASVLDDPALYTDTFMDSVIWLMRELRQLADNIPMRLCDSVDVTDEDELVSSIHQCIAASCEVILISNSLRRAFIKAEVGGRVKRISCNMY